MPSTTLPAPEIEIGSRLPVHTKMPRIRIEDCELVHKAPEKLHVAAGGTTRLRAIRQPPDLAAFWLTALTE